MTEGHKHRHIHVPFPFPFYVRSLRWGILHTRNLERVEKSPYPYGPCSKREGPCAGHRECWTLSALGILHRWTGLTIEFDPSPEEE